MRRAALYVFVAVLAAVTSAQVAWAHGGPARPNPFVWTSPRLGFHGEGDLIRALEKIGLEFMAPNAAHHYDRRAETLLKRAYPVLCSPVARNEVLVAIGHLRNYRLTHGVGYLQAAARSVRRALEVEHRCHMALRPPAPAVTVPTVIHQTVVTPAPVVAPAPVLVVPRTHLHFGGKNWMVGISF